MKYVIAALMLITAASAHQGASGNFTEIGPDGVYQILGWGNYTVRSTPSNNTRAANEIQELLSSYALTKEIKDGEMDCSDISEIIWYVLKTNGYNCSIIGNGGKSNGKYGGHAFVWAKVDDGVIVIETTWDAKPDERIGVVLTGLDEEEDAFYLTGWEFGDPTTYIEITGFDYDMSGITLYTPIEELPIRRKAAC